MTQQRRAVRRKQHVSKRGHAPPPATAHGSHRRLRWRNRWIRGFVWVFVVLFAASILGVALISIRR
ncbi:MAG: hypothetical protein JO060_04060 [Candidatus Eremiobacteraeota bacterium]|nr:hypothetical protein [Candidatus Eremiobacteraeota bacterium]